MTLILPRDLKSIKVGDKVKITLPRAECVFVVDEFYSSYLYHYQDGIGIYAYFNEKHPLTVEIV